MRRVGAMTWEEMNWLFPDFEDTDLLYHGADPDNLISIFQRGLIAGYGPRDQHQTIYDTHARHRPDNIPDWVDPRRCIFGYINRPRQGACHRIGDGKVVQADLGITAIPAIIERTWVCCAQFSDWVYCPREAGYLDTDARTRYYQSVVEPACSGAYWRTSLSFAENLSIRHDQLLHMQGYQELLICLDVIMPIQLSLQAFRVKRDKEIREVVRQECPDLFAEAEHKLRHQQSISDEMQAVISYVVTFNSASI